ncbi:MAG: hypothetical protein GAK30_02941 [Paracidovorax wautersii]|uniref:Probable membrane transporter protein n=1 Tax=Paracidovorax wautersii TaxID=1177982 RepID=A0A7V8JPI0_9BURK|nr:MAG: hypothetical protein GAK30_02941 [Paracidovorax wautersii]
MNDLSLMLLLQLALIFVAGGVVKGVTGMGLPTVAMGLLSAMLSPAAAAALLVAPSFVTNVWQWLAGAATAGLLRRLWPMMLAIAVGTVGGSALLARVDPLWSGLALGMALMAYAAYALAAPPLAVPPRLEPWLSPLVGLVTGVVTGATGVFVIPAVPYLQSLRLDKDALVQALGLSFTVSTLALATGLAAHGALRLEQLGLSSLAIVPALAGMWLGQAVRARISPKGFRLCFLLFLLLLGLELASRPLR